MDVPYISWGKMQVTVEQAGLPRLNTSIPSRLWEERHPDTESHQGVFKVQTGLEDRQEALGPGARMGIPEK